MHFLRLIVVFQVVSVTFHAMAQDYDNGDNSQICTADDQCNVSWSCINGICTLSNRGCNPVCEFGQVCVNGYCQDVEQQLMAATPAPTQAPPPTQPPPPAPTTASPPAPPSKCAQGWQYNTQTNYCYYVGMISVTQGQANVYCYEAGAELVWFNQSDFMTDQTEMMWVNNLALTSGLQTYWMGAMKTFAGGVLTGGWVWPNGKLVMYPNWRSGQPDGCCGGDVRCVLVNYVGSGGLWDDAGCNRIWANLQGFICKKKPS